MKPAATTTRTRILAAFNKPGCAPATIEDLTTLGESLLREISALGLISASAERYVSKRELMKLLGVSDQALNTALHKTKAQGLAFGKYTRYPLQATLRLLRDHFAA